MILGVQAPQRASLWLATALIVAALLVAIAGSLLKPAPADAHWAGFTGDWNFCNGYTYTSGGKRCYGSPFHSYGFTSANDNSGTGFVCAGAGTGLNPDIYASCGYDFVRSCYDGTYPNCHDADGYSVLAYVYNGSTNARVVRGHGVY